MEPRGVNAMSMTRIKLFFANESAPGSSLSAGAGRDPAHMQQAAGKPYCEAALEAIARQHAAEE